MIDIPALRAGDDEAGRDDLRRAGWDDGHLTAAAYLFAGWIEDAGLKGDACLLSRTVADLGLHGDGRLVVSDCGSGDIRSPVRDVHGAGDIQPHIAIDAGAGIPARGALFG